MCTKFGIDSSARFTFRARTHTDHPTHASAAAGVGKSGHFRGELELTKVVFETIPAPQFYTPDAIAT